MKEPHNADPNTTVTTEQGFEQQQADLIHSIRPSRLIIPILIGLIVVGYLLWQQFDPKVFAEISWTSHTFFWIGMSLFFLALRHFSYMMRLYILSDKEFSLKKCFELIFIWEFSTAISPTSVGGSAVALFVISQEKLTAAKTTTIIIYTMILDALYFLLMLPLLYLIFGGRMIGLEGWGGSMGAASIVILTYSVMFLYSSGFFYGIFINPKTIKSTLLFFCRFPLLKRYKERAEKLGNDIILASAEMQQKSWSYHIGAFISTVGAWTCRFLLINCLIIAFTVALDIDFWTHILAYARLNAMFIILLLFPSPGGAGFAESGLGIFLEGIVPPTLAIIIAIIWRLFAYYGYLLAGVIVIPNWIKNVINERRKERELENK